MAWSKCTACDTAFTSLSAFDKHIKGVEPAVHLDPAKIGLEWSDESKAWRHENNGQFDFAKKVNTPPTEEKVYSCAGCGGGFVKKPGRGRPPKHCSNCGGKGVPKN